MKRLALIALGTLIATTAAACGGSSSPSTVVSPSTTVVTETFTGTVQPLGTDSHNFTVTSPGTITVTLTAAGPPATITMALGVGNPDQSGTCVFLSGGTTSAVAGTSPQLSGTLTSSGTYCVAVGDVGNAAGPITYSVTVSHT